MVDEQVLSGLADFLSSFTDGCHHAKEEDLLFPMLLKRGVSSKGCPVGTLALEHQQGRNVVKALNSAVEKYRSGDPRGASKISADLKDATDLYTDHIWREDYLLFPMSNKVLLDTDRDALMKSFDEVQKKFGPAFQQKYERIVDRLEKSLTQTEGLPKEGARQPSASTASVEGPACLCGRTVPNGRDSKGGP